MTELRKPARALLTVVMPMYNAMPFAEEAIRSILDQTFSDFYFVIYDDASTDASYETAQRLASADRRIRLLRGDRRLGPVGSSNAAAQAARTTFVARMDADDVARPDRLELQLKAMASHPDAVLVGSFCDLIDARGRVLKRATRAKLRSGPLTIGHNTILYRRTAWEAAGRYTPGTDFFEDADLYKRMARLGKMLILPESLVSYRIAGQNARSLGDRLEVEAQLSSQYQSAELGVRGERITEPEVYHGLALLRIFANKRPQLLARALRLQRMNRIAPNVRSLGLIVLGTISPAAARWVSPGHRGFERRDCRTQLR